MVRIGEPLLLVGLLDLWLTAFFDDRTAAMPRD